MDIQEEIIKIIIHLGKGIADIAIEQFKNKERKKDKD